MANSLTIGGLEMVGWATNPEYHLGKHTNSGPGSGQDFGEILPDTDVISSLLLDGDVITGERTGNRTWNLVVVVKGSSRADLSSKIDTFVSAINQDTYTVTWTPSNCPTSVFTAYRATFAVAKDFSKNDELVGEVTLSFETTPFAKSLNPQSTTVNATGGPTSLQVDGMNTGTFTTGTLDTTKHYEGAGSGKSTSSASAPTLGRTVASTNISAYSAVTARLIATSTTFTPTAFYLDVTDGSHQVTVSAISTPTLTTSAWSLVSFSIAQILLVNPSFNLTALSSWQIRAVLPLNSTARQFNADDLRAVPTSVSNGTAEGSVLTVPAISGSARTPVALAISRSITVQSSGNLFSAADSSFETGSVGTFVGSNATLVVAGAGLQGTHSLQMTASSAATMSAHTANSGTMMAVAPSTAYTLIGSAHANVTVRSFQITVTWYDSTGTSISSNSTTAGNDVTSGWATQTANVTSPSNAAYAAITVTVTSPASGEVHLFDALGLIVGSSQSWVIGTGTYQTVGAQTMTNLLLHSPPSSQDPDLTILAGLAAGAVTIPAANMNYAGTYSVVVFFSASVGGSTSRLITVTFTQKVGATTVGTTTITATLVGTQTLASIGEVVLPITGVPVENTSGSLVISVSSGNGSDVFSDVALCDTEGQTVLLTGMANPALSGPAASVYVDAPDPTVGLGPVYASTGADRTLAQSVLSLAQIAGGPILFEPGSNKILAASTNGAPNATVTYTPAWLDEALV